MGRAQKKEGFLAYHGPRFSRPGSPQLLELLHIGDAEHRRLVGTQIPDDPALRFQAHVGLSAIRNRATGGPMMGMEEEAEFGGDGVEAAGGDEEGAGF